MKSNLNLLDRISKRNARTSADDQKLDSTPTKDRTNSQHSDTHLKADAAYLDEPSSRVVPDETAKHFGWKRRRKTWMPTINVISGFLVLLVILAQATMYYQQRQIIDRQSQFMARQAGIMDHSLRLSEQRLRVSERAYVGVASVSANMKAAEILVTLHNIGKVPANALKLEAQEIRVTPSANSEWTESKESVHEKQMGSTFRWDAGDVQLFPGIPMPVGIPMRRFKQEEINAVLEKKEILYIGGTIQYEDGFGNGDSTTFAFEYTPPPNERWTAHSDLSKFFKHQDR